MKQSPIVISLGGSLIAPSAGLDISFLKKFQRFILGCIARKGRFVIVAGGGVLARDYQNAAGKLANADAQEKDWLGIHATRLNAQLLRTLFKKEAHPILLNKKDKISSFGKQPIIIGAGWEPGFSTDYVAVQAALDFKASLVLNIGRADYVYSHDFIKNPKAEPIVRLSWREYLHMIPKRFSPGLHVPLDPIAAHLAAKHNLRVIIAGADLKNAGNILSGKSFKGTTIENKQ